MADHSTCWASGYSAGYERAFRDMDADSIARALCREKCAFFGEPPCFETGDWPNTTGCCEPGCHAEAAAVIAALLALLFRERRFPCRES